MTPWRAALLVSTLVGGLVAGSAGVDAQDDDAGDDEEASTTSTQPLGDIEMRLIDQSFDVEPGDPIELTYRLTGDLESAEITVDTTGEAAPSEDDTADTDEPEEPAADDAGADDADGTGEDDEPEPPPPPIPIVVQVVNWEPFERADQLDQAMGPGSFSRLVSSLGDFVDGVAIDVRPMITVDEDDPDTAILRLTVPTETGGTGLPDADRLEFRSTGLHPVVVELKVGDEAVAAHGTAIDRRDDDLALPATDLSLLTAIDDPGPGGTLAEIRADIDAVDRTADVAVEVDAPLTMSIPPNIGRIASETSTRNNLPEAFADDELISAPATPFDVSSAVAVDRIDAFANQLTFGEDELRDAFPSTAVRRDAWLVTTPISAEAAIELRDRAVRYMIMPADLFERSISSDLPATDQFVEIDLGNGSVMPILVIDELGESFTRSATDDILDELNATEWSISTITRLRFEQYALPRSQGVLERSRILATPSLAEPDPRLIVELERLAETTSAIRFSAASELTGLTSTQSTDEPLAFPETAGPDLSERLDQINLTILSLASVDSMLPEDDPRFPEWQRQLDGFVSTAYDDAEVSEAIDAILAEADVIRSGVIPPEPISFTLTGNEGTIDLNIGNRLDEPITVVLRLTSPRLSFPDGEQTITLAPSSTQTVQVPVRARSNGTSSVDVDILTPSGDPLVETVTLKSRVNSLTGLGQALTAGLVLILLTWWFSNWRRKRRRQNTPGEPESGTAPTPA